MAKVRTMIRLEDELKLAAEAYAKEESRTLANLIELALRAYLKEKGRVS